MDNKPAGINVKPSGANVDAVLVLSFGGPEKAADVMPFLRNVTSGRGVPDERLAVVARQYEIFGGRSPINDLSRELVAALQSEMAGNGSALPVYWGTRNWHPSLEETVQTMVDDGIQNALVFTGSAFASYSGCRQYEEDMDRARVAVGELAPQLTKLRLYFNHPGFIDPLAQNTMAAIAEHEQPDGKPVRPEDVRLVFTAHSLPTAMAAACDYEEQLNEAMTLVLDRMGPHRPTDYSLVFQSRSGAPSSPWLGPDIVDYLDLLASQQVIPGAKTQPVTIVPLGFTADHMEVLFDLDVQAAKKAQDLSIPLTRAKTVGTHHMFIKMIRELIEEEVAGGPRLALGSMGPTPAHHGPGHCRAK